MSASLLCFSLSIDRPQNSRPTLAYVLTFGGWHLIYGLTLVQACMYVCLCAVCVCAQVKVKRARVETSARPKPRPRPRPRLSRAAQTQACREGEHGRVAGGVGLRMSLKFFEGRAQSQVTL